MTVATSTLATSRVSASPMGGCRGSSGGGMGHLQINQAAHIYPHSLIKPSGQASPWSWLKTLLCYSKSKRQYHLWEECPVAIAFNNNAVHWQCSHWPLTPLLLYLSPRIIFRPLGHGLRKETQLIWQLIWTFWIGLPLATWPCPVFFCFFNS